MTDRLIALRVGEHLYGLDIAVVREALTGRSLLTVPLAPSPIAGLLLLRGDVVTAVDLRLALGAGPVAADTVAADTVDAIVAEDRSLVLALVVDEIGDVVDVPAGELRPPPDALPEAVARLARGTCLVGGHPILVLDPAQLFASASASTKELVR